MNNTMAHISQDDLAIYAMQFLTGEEAAAVAQHLEICPECRMELEAVRGDLAIYAMTAEMHSPPAQTRQQLLKQVSREKKLLPEERNEYADRTVMTDASLSLLPRGRSYLDAEETPRRNIAGAIFAWAGWAVAAGVSFTAVNLYHQRDTLRGSVVTQRTVIDRQTVDVAKARQILDALIDPSAMRVTLTKAEAPATPIGRATYVPEKGTLIFLASNMEPLEAYKTYELWLIPADGRDPMPAGTFHPDTHGNASVIMPDMPKGIAAKAFGVTVEDEGGSQTPTKPIILVGM